MDHLDVRGKVFIGVVESNEDPQRLGRVKVRVMDVFDSIPVEDIPFATPYKDLNGNEFNVPEKGKVVSIIFDEGNIYKPEYLYAEHYNINLENKLKDISLKDYLSMKSLMFDHKTQIYSNDSEGLKIDYKMNNINLTEDTIDINLKDNKRKLRLGSSSADQQIILGNHFMEWFDEFLENLLRGPYLGNLGSPVISDPQFIAVLLKYKTLRDEKFLSRHITAVDNEYVKIQERPAVAQIGDKWNSTVRKNDLLRVDEVNFRPQKGNSTDNPVGNLTSYVDDKGQVVQPPANFTPPPPVVTNNKDVDRILNLMRKKNYKILDRPFEVNIVGIRKQYEGQPYSNAFKDDLYLIYKIDTSDNWEIRKYKISTMPGFYYGFEKGNRFEVDYSRKSKINVKQSKMMLSRGVAPNNGMGILMEAQYLNIYYIGKFLGKRAMMTKGPQKFYRDNSPSDIITYTGKGEGVAGMFIHKAYPGGTTVDNWSEGCQVFANSSDLEEFFDICEKHKEKYGNNFNYTLMLGRELET